MPLDAARQLAMLLAFVAWRADSQRPVACPACGTAGMTIIDRSARPHAEWYALQRSACNLSETLHIALGAAVPTLD